MAFCELKKYRKKKCLQLNCMQLPSEQKEVVRNCSFLKNEESIKYPGYDNSMLCTPSFTFVVIIDKIRVADCSLMLLFVQFHSLGLKSMCQCAARSAPAQRPRRAGQQWDCSFTCPFCIWGGSASHKLLQLLWENT